MKAGPVFKYLLYGAIIFLSLVALGLVLTASPEFLKNKLIYEGF